MGYAREAPSLTPQPEDDHSFLVEAKKDIDLTIEEMRDFLYAKAIAPETLPEIKTFLDPFEIATAGPERLQELQDRIIYPNSKPDNIIQFPGSAGK